MYGVDRRRMAEAAGVMAIDSRRVVETGDPGRAMARAERPSGVADGDRGAIRLWYLAPCHCPAPRRTRITGTQSAQKEEGSPALRGTREGWRSPGGIGAIASVAGVLVAVLAIIVGSQPSAVVQQPSPTRSATYFFVYGTTMPGHLRYSLIEEFVAEATPDRVTGRIYDSGSGYPAAKFGGGQTWIEGYRLEIREGREAEARRSFTEFESGLYEPVTLRTADGFTVTAYEWIDSVDGFEELAGRWDRPEQ